MPSLITKRGRKRYVGNLMVRGQRRSKLFPDDSALSYTQAQAWEEETRLQLSEGVTEKLLISTLISQYLEIAKKRFTRKTYLAKRNVLFRFIRLIKAGHMVVDITTSKILQYFSTQKQRSGGALNDDMKHLKAAWAWGRDHIADFPEVDPFQKISRYPSKKHQRRVPTEAEFWQVFNTANEKQDRAMLATIFYTAARPIEVFRLTIDDLDFTTGRLCLWSRKGKNHDYTGRWVPMPGRLKNELRSWLDLKSRTRLKDKRHIFISLHFRNYGRPFQERRYFMRCLCKKAMVKPFGMYGLRHLRAQIEYEKIPRISALQRLLGHEYASTTDAYLKKYGLDVVKQMPLFKPSHVKRRTYRSEPPGCKNPDVTPQNK